MCVDGVEGGGGGGDMEGIVKTYTFLSIYLSIYFCGDLWITNINMVVGCESGNAPVAKALAIVMTILGKSCKTKM